MVAKINSTGEWEWARSIGGSGGDLASGVTLSDNNLLQVAGSVQGLGYFNGQNQVGLETKNTTYVVELDTNGDFLRQKSFEGISINDIETSEAGDTLISGTHSGETNYFGSIYQSPDATDVFVALYDYRSPKAYRSDSQGWSPGTLSMGIPPICQAEGMMVMSMEQNLQQTDTESRIRLITLMGMITSWCRKAPLWILLKN